jgi:DNA-directed RNA polymerase specialized sigma24 family protein
MPTPQAPMIDYQRLLDRLAERACDVLNVGRFVAEDFVVDGLGKSPVDFSVDVFVLYLTDALPFTGDEEALYHFLAEVMVHDILDQKRSSARKTTKKVPHLSGEVDDAGKLQIGLDDFDSGFSIDQLVEGDLFKERLYALLKPTEPELCELAEAIFELNVLTPREIADVIGTTPSEIQNRKKRLKTFLGKHPFAAPQKRN